MSTGLYFSALPAPAAPRVRIINTVAKPKKQRDANTIAVNRKAGFDYFLEDQFEAGLVLEGWEVKSLREGRAQLKESYVIVQNGEVFLVGAHFSPLTQASTHIQPKPTRARKRLLHKQEICKLIGATEREGYTLAPLSLYWSKGKAKLKIALAKGKKQHDKRQTIKQREWDRDKARLLKR